MATLPGQSRPEPMNASPYHSKVKVSLTLSDPLFVAGGQIAGKMELECRADKGLGIGIVLVELLAIQELTSRDHSATSTFLHLTRRFQGPGLPPSNAVHPYPLPGQEPLPAHHWPARRGLTTFFYRFPVPISSPSSIDFGKGLAKLRYEVRASVGVGWKGERRLVTDKLDVDVVEAFDEFASEGGEKVIIGESGKLWVQGRIVNRVLVAGQSGCVELYVKNHSNKKTSSLSLSLTRQLHLVSHSRGQAANQSLQISDTLSSTSFKGPEYIVLPGTEGVANLLFDVPHGARGVRGGLRDGGDENGEDGEEGRENPNRYMDGLFEVKCIVSVKIGMGIGSKDVVLEIPATVVHPSALPPSESLPPPAVTAQPYAPVAPPLYQADALQRIISPPPVVYTPQLPNYTGHPVTAHSPPPPIASPPLAYPHAQYTYAHPGLQQFPNYINMNVPPPIAPGYIPPQAYYPSPDTATQLNAPYYYPAPALTSQPPRPSSADPYATPQLPAMPTGSKDTQGSGPHSYEDAPHSVESHVSAVDVATTGEVGKGELATRVSSHLRILSRHRSMSPTSHRFPLQGQPPPAPASIAVPVRDRRTSITHLQPYMPHSPGHSVSSNGELHSPRPMLSPKHSFHVDPITRQATGRSENVEKLERIAYEETKSPSPPEGTQAQRAPADKTLPKIPNGGDDALLRVEELLLRGRSAHSDEAMTQAGSDGTAELPPPPTLAPVTPAKRREYNLEPGGLDALERKLLEQVGTRKPPKPTARKLDIKDLAPISIPPPDAQLDPPNDSAISSLSLADEPLALDKHLPELKRPQEGRRVSAGKSQKVTKEQKRGRGQTKKEEAKERVRNAERLRKAATGRVAAWLGGIDPEEPPPVVETPPPTSPRPSLADVPSVEEPPHPLLRQSPEPEEQLHTTPTKTASRIGIEPIPARSSGFVLHPSVIRQNTEETLQPPDNESASGSKTATIIAKPALPSPKVVTPRSISPKAAGNPVKNVNGLRWPRLQPQADPNAKYDVRSARGGKGGKVSAVTALWASIAEQEKQSTPNKAPVKMNAALPAAPIPRKPAPRTNANKSGPSTPARTPKPVALAPSAKGRPSPPTAQNKVKEVEIDTNVADLTARRAKMIKSTTVPAVISSSLARPVLSSTVSLARPVSNDYLPSKPKPAFSLPTAPAGSDSRKGGSTAQSPRPADTGHLAFGQARLKDLIKKYQQGS